MAQQIEHAIQLSGFSNKARENPEPVRRNAGDLFVLESKGTWAHAGYHLTSATAVPVLLTLPFALSGLGWGPGIVILCLGAVLAVYTDYLLAVVMEHMEDQGKRFLRFRDLTRHVIGKRWSRYLVAPLQFALCFMTVIGCTLLGGQCMKEIYLQLNIPGHLKLYQFIIIFGCLTLFLSQLPSLHSLRHFNFIAILLCIGYSVCAVTGSIVSGYSKSSPRPDYSLPGRPIHRLFAASNAVSIIMTTYGNPLVVESQLHLQPTFEVWEGMIADVNKGKFSFRNFVPRLLGRSTFVITATILSAMLPFFEDITALMGAFGCVPLCVLFPLIFYTKAFKPAPHTWPLWGRNLIFWVNNIIMAMSVVVLVLGCVASLRNIILDAGTYRLFANL